MPLLTELIPFCVYVAIKISLLWSFVNFCIEILIHVRHSTPPPKQSASSRVQLGKSHLVRKSGPRKQQRNDDWPMHFEARPRERPSLPSELLGNAGRGSRPDPAHAH